LLLTQHVFDELVGLPSDRVVALIAVLSGF
jgi:hypothetical protein